MEMMKEKIKNEVLSTVEQHLFGLVDLGSQVGRSSIVRMVSHHQYSMPGLYS